MDNIAALRTKKPIFAEPMSSLSSFVDMEKEMKQNSASYNKAVSHWGQCRGCLPENCISLLGRRYGTVTLICSRQCSAEGTSVINITVKSKSKDVYYALQLYKCMIYMSIYRTWQPPAAHRTLISLSGNLHSTDTAKYPD